MAPIMNLSLRMARRVPTTLSFGCRRRFTPHEEAMKRIEVLDRTIHSPMLRFGLAGIGMFTVVGTYLMYEKMCLVHERIVFMAETQLAMKELLNELQFDLESLEDDDETDDIEAKIRELAKHLKLMRSATRNEVEKEVDSFAE